MSNIKDTGKVRLGRIQKDMLDNSKLLTNIRNSDNGYGAEEIRNLAGKCDIVSSHLFQIANELEDKE